MDTYSIRDSVAVLRHYTDALERAAAAGDEDAAQRAVATLRQEVERLELATASQGTAADITRSNGRLTIQRPAEQDPRTRDEGDRG